jgi:UDP-glucose 4-epimerase
MKNILILGGTGFIGRNILEELEGGDYNIFLLSRRKDLTSLVSKRINVVQGSLKDTDLIESIISNHDIEILLHLASNLIPSSSKSQFEEEINNIVLPTFKLLSFISRKNIKLIYFSSGGAIYGKAEGKINEKNECEPINYHGHSKLLIETHVKLLNKTDNLKYLILRPSNVYGKYQRLESKQGFIAVALGRILSNQDIEIWGDGNTIRDYVDVSDISRVVRILIEDNIENKIFNLGSGEGHSLIRVVDLLENQLKKSANIIYQDKREVDLDRLVLDISSIESFVDYKPQKLEEGIKSFISHLKHTKNNGK